MTTGQPSIAIPGVQEHLAEAVAQSNDKPNGIGSFRPKVDSPDGSQVTQTKSICPMCICRSLSLRKKNNRGKTVRTAHEESKVN